MIETAQNRIKGILVPLLRICRKYYSRLFTIKFFEFFNKDLLSAPAVFSTLLLPIFAGLYLRGFRDFTKIANLKSRQKITAKISNAKFNTPG